MTFDEFLKEVGCTKVQVKTFTTEIEALEAVKQNGYSIRYVKDQTFKA